MRRGEGGQGGGGLGVGGKVTIANAYLSHAHITDYISQHLELPRVHHYTDCWDHKPNLLALAGRALAPRSPALGMRRISSGSCSAAGWLADAQVYLEGVKHPPGCAQPCWKRFAGLCIERLLHKACKLMHDRNYFAHVTV